MFKLCAAFVTLGLIIGTARSVKRQTEQFTAQIAELGLTLNSSPLVIRPAPPHGPSSAPSESERLDRVAKDLGISGERLRALAQDATSDCDGTVCIEVMIAVWGPAEVERVVHEIDTRNALERPGGA